MPTKEGRRLLKNYWIAVTFAVCIASPANALTWDTVGAGAESCAQFSRAVAIDPAAADDAYFRWAQGYMSGINKATPGSKFRNLAAKTSEQGKAFVRLYCAAKPFAPYREAVMAFFNRLPISEP